MAFLLSSNRQKKSLNTHNMYKKYDLIAFIYFITMSDQKPLFKSPYDIRDVSALFTIVAFVLVIAAILGNNLFGIFQESINFG